MSSSTGHDAGRSGPVIDGGNEWFSYAIEPVYDADWVDTTVLGFLGAVEGMPQSRRLQCVQAYLEKDIAELRDTVRFSCDDFRVLPSEDETYTSNISLVADAIRRVSFWNQKLQRLVIDADIHAKDLRSDMDKVNQQVNESENTNDDVNEDGNNDGIKDENNDGSQDQPMEDSHQGSDSSDEQPMDISSNSSNDGGGIIAEEKESALNGEPRPQSLPDTTDPAVVSRPQAAPVAAATPASAAERKKNTKRKFKSGRATNNRRPQPTYGPAAPGTQAHVERRRPSGPLLHHPSLPPRPPSPRSSLPPRPPPPSSWGSYRRF